MYIFLSICRVFVTTIQLAGRLCSCLFQHIKKASGSYSYMGPNIGHNIICLHLPLRIFQAVVLKSLALSCTSSCLTPMKDGSNPCSCKSCHINCKIQYSGPCCLLHLAHTRLLANRFLEFTGTDLLDSRSDRSNVNPNCGCSKSELQPLYILLLRSEIQRRLSRTTFQTHSSMKDFSGQSLSKLEMP